MEDQAISTEPWEKAKMVSCISKLKLVFVVFSYDAVTKAKLQLDEWTGRWTTYKSIG